MSKPKPRRAAGPGAPTQPMPKSNSGHVLDEFGLPVSGPARRAALAGRPDPRAHPRAWADGGKPAGSSIETHSAADAEQQQGDAK